MADWPGPAASWLVAARHSGVAVVEVYPAGDRAWNGLGLHRARLAREAACAAWPPLAGLPAVLVGIGQGATGAVALAERDPLAWRGLALVAPRLLLPLLSNEPLQRWLDLHRAGRRPEHLGGLPLICAGPLPDGLASWRGQVEQAGSTLVANLPGPEEAAFWRILATNAATRQNGPSRWVALEPGRYGTTTVVAMEQWGRPGIMDAAHQEGIADSLTTDEASPRIRSGKRWRAATGPLAAYADRPFVVVVGTGEHAAALAANQELAQRFVDAWKMHAHGWPPVLRDSEFASRAWPNHNLVLIGNTRSNRVLAHLIDAERLPVRWDGRAVQCAGISILRSTKPAVALCWPHPADDGRLLVILDGSPVWSDDGLPLAGLPDLVLGPVDRPLVWKLFGNDWR
jgi:hypothetical protein